MQVFHSEQISARDFRTEDTNPKPLMVWWPAAKAAYDAAGKPAGKIVVRSRMVYAGHAGDVHDGIRGASSALTPVREVGVI